MTGPWKEATGMVTTAIVLIGTIMLFNCNNKCAIIVVMLFNVTVIILMLSRTLPKISVFKIASKKKMFENH